MSNAWQTFWNITINHAAFDRAAPDGSGFAMNFGNLELIYLLTEGGPFKSPLPWAGATDLLSTYVYVAFGAKNFDYGLASANGMLIFSDRGW
jgi:ABC-type sugar transport system permease subunit